MHQLRVCSAVCICISIFVYVRGSWNISQTCLSCSWNKTQTRFCLTLNNFPKSQLFANINVFELFDLPKSRLYYYFIRHMPFCGQKKICSGVISLKQIKVIFVANANFSIYILPSPNRRRWPGLSGELQASGVITQKRIVRYSGRKSSFTQQQQQRRTIILL